MPNRSLDDFVAGGGAASAADDADDAEDGHDDSPGEGPTPGADADEGRSPDENTLDADAPDVTPTDADAPDVTPTDADAPDAEPDTLATYRWTPEGAPCPACGESVRERWLDGDEYVCADCKDW